MMSYDERKHHHEQNSEHTYHSQKFPFTPLQSICLPCTPTPLPTIHLLSVAINYHPFPGILYECIPLFGLASFTYQNYFDMPPYYSTYQQFIPFYCSVLLHYMDIP